MFENGVELARSPSTVKLYTYHRSSDEMQQIVVCCLFSDSRLTGDIRPFFLVILMQYKADITFSRSTAYKQQHQPTRLKIAPDKPQRGGLAKGVTDSGICLRIA
jgi:hypothetical protein